MNTLTTLLASGGALNVAVMGLVLLRATLRPWQAVRVEP